mmetsp:Transcript_32821/g.59928  ORF Transcript_32821/g.59928 Transcript_32821/m.59928 type:complete len:239 (-) Transcript_32821:653-1369(-)
MSAAKKRLLTRRLRRRRRHCPPRRRRSPSRRSACGGQWRWRPTSTSCSRPKKPWPKLCARRETGGCGPAWKRVSRWMTSATLLPSRLPPRPPSRLPSRPRSRPRSRPWLRCRCQQVRQLRRGGQSSSLGVRWGAKSPSQATPWWRWKWNQYELIQRPVRLSSVKLTQEKEKRAEAAAEQGQQQQQQRVRGKPKRTKKTTTKERSTCTGIRRCGCSCPPFCWSTSFWPSCARGVPEKLC